MAGDAPIQIWQGLLGSWVGFDVHEVREQWLVSMSLRSSFQGNHHYIINFEKVYFPSQIFDQKSMVLIRWIVNKPLFISKMWQRDVRSFTTLLLKQSLWDVLCLRV